MFIPVDYVYDDGKERLEALIEERRQEIKKRLQKILSGDCIEAFIDLLDAAYQYDMPEANFFYDKLSFDALDKCALSDDVNEFEHRLIEEKADAQASDYIAQW